MAANLFLAREMQQSATLKGFIDYRGTPDTLEVKKEFFGPLLVMLYYYEELESYTLEQGSTDWLIKGPTKIPPSLLSAFLKATPEVEDESYPPPRRTPAVRPVRPAPPDNEDRERRPKAPLVSERKNKTPKKESAKQGSRSADVRRNSDERGAPGRTSDDRRDDSGPADVLKATHARVDESSSGDIIHQVTFPGENLRIISSWYTGTEENAWRIARINGIENPDAVQINQHIRIPRYMLKTMAPLPRSATE